MNLRFFSLVLGLSGIVFFSSLSGSPFDLDTCRTVTYTVGLISTTTLDSGKCDTLRVGGPCPVEYDAAGLDSLRDKPDSIAIPILAWFDETMAAFSFGFMYNSDMVEITSVSRVGSTVPSTWISSNYFIPSENMVLCGYVDLFGTSPMPPTSGDTAKLLFTLYIRVLSGATAHYVNFDSVFIPPAGPFIFASLIDTVFHMGYPAETVPVFVQCDSTYVLGEPSDINLPVTEIDQFNIPQTYSLSQNVPNPFNPTTQIDFSLPRSGDVRVEIFNVMGQKVRTLVNEYLKAGFKRATWDGTDERGSQVSSGVYFYRMTASEFTETKKMLMLK